METPTSTGTATQPAPLKPWKQVAEESNIFSLPPEQRIAEYDKWSAENVAQGIRDGDFDSPDTFSQFKLFDIRTRKNLISDDIIGPSDEDIATEYDSFTKSFQDTQRAFAADKPTPQDEAIQGEVLQGKRKSAFVRGQMVFNPAVVNDPQKYREAILESDAPADIKMFYAGLRPEMEKSATVTRRRDLANSVITRDVADKVVTAIQEGAELFGMDIGTPQSPALKKNKDGVWSVVDPEYSDKETSFLGRANAKYNPLADSLYKPLPAINEYQKKYGLTDEQVQQDYMESLIENAPTTVNRWLSKATSIEDYVKQLDSTVRVKNKDVAPEVRVQDPNLFFDEQGYNAAVDKASAPDEAKTLAKAARTQFADAVAGDIYNNLLNNRDDFRENYAKDVVSRGDMEKAITRYYKDKKDQAWYDDVGEVIGQAGTAAWQGLKDLVMMPSAIKGMFGDVEAAENYRYYTLAQQGEMQAEEAVANRTGGAGFIGLNNDVMRIIPDLVVQMGIAVATGGTLSGAQASLVAARTGISRAAATTALRQAAITGEKAALKSQLLRLIPEVTSNTVDDVAEEVLKASARTASNNPFKGGIGTQRAVGSAYAGLTSAASTFGQVYTDVVKMGKSPEEAIATARTAGVVAGAITSGLTHSFGMLGRGGVEDFASMGRKAGEFTIRDIVNAGLLDSLTTQEGRQLMRNIAKGISKDALSEGAEEGLDQALNLISQYATNPSPEAQNRKATDIINESLYGGLLGIIAGGGTASIGQARATAPGITAQQMQAEIIGAQTIAPQPSPLAPQPTAPSQQAAPQPVAPAPTAQPQQPIAQPAAVPPITPEEQANYDAAKAVVIAEQSASISLLQRKLRLGYGRAQRIMDLLEQDGVIAPKTGAGSQSVLVQPQTPVVQPSANPAVQEAQATVESLAEIPDTTQTAAALAALANSATFTPPENNLPKIEVPTENTAPDVAPAAVTEQEGDTEIEEFRALNLKRGQAQNGVKGATFSKKDKQRYQELFPKVRDRLRETVDPEADPIVGVDINQNPIRVSEKGTFYTVENGRIRTGPAFEENQPGQAEEQAAPVNAEETPVEPAPVADEVEPETTENMKTPARDTTKPEQMTPEEMRVAKGIKPFTRFTFDSKTPKEDSAKSKKELAISDKAQMEHRDAIKKAAEASLPISSFSVDAYGITLPPGYVKQGELYVYQPEQKAEAETAQVIPKKTLKEISAYPDFSDRVTGGNMLDASDVSRYLAFRESTTSIPKADVAKAKKDLKNPTVSEIEAALSKYAEERNQKNQENKNISAALKRTGESDELDTAISNYNQAKTNLDSARAKRNNPIAGVQWETKLLSSQVGDAQKKLSDAGKKLIAVAGKVKQPKPTKQDAVQEPSSDASVLRQEGQEVGLPEVDQGGRGAEQKAAGKEGEVKDGLTREQEEVVVFIEQETNDTEEAVVAAEKKKKRITPGKARKVGIAKQIDRLGITSNDPDSVISALEKIANNPKPKPSEKHHIRIAKDLLSVLKDSGVKIQLVSGNDARMAKHDSRVNGWYDPKTNTAYINLDGPHELGIEETILHELVHASGEKVIQNPQTDAQKRILADLEKQMLAARKNAIALGQAKLGTDVTELGLLTEMAAAQNDYGLFDILYGVSSLSEYHAHATTSRSFQKFLTTYKEGGKRSLLERLINSITSLLSGKKTAEGSDAEKAYTTLLDLMRENKGDVRLSNADVVQSRARGASTERDAEYLELAKDPEKNAEALQAMVDAAAKEAGYRIEAFHGTDAPLFTEFQTEREEGKTSDPNAFMGSHFTANKDVAEQFANGRYGAKGGRVMAVRIKMENPMQEGSGSTLVVGEGLRGKIADLREKYNSTPDGSEWARLQNNPEALAEAIEKDIDALFVDPKRDAIKKEIADAEIELSNLSYKNRPVYEEEIFSMLGENYQRVAAIIDGLKGAERIDYAKSIGTRLRKKMLSKGYDGVIYENLIETTKKPYGTNVAYIVAYPEQIKSADPVTRDDAGNIIPLSQRFQSTSQDIRFSRARGRFDLVDAVRAASSGDASTPFQALNEAINANTELTRRIQAESERRNRAYARGKGAILEQIIRAGNTGRLPEEAIKPITDFVNSVSPQALADTRISLSAKPQNSTFDFVDSLVTLALNGMGSEPGEIDRTAIHEFWHGLSRFIPDDEIEKIRKDYVAAVKEYISENPWFVPFIGRTRLSEAQYDDLSRMLSQEEMDAIPWKNWETLEDGRRIRGLKWTKENYRLFRLDEWVAETMADLVRRKQERPTTFLGKMARLFRDFIDTLKQALGNPYLKALDAMTAPDEAFDAQIERFGPIEDNPPVMYGGEGVGMNNQFAESKARSIVSDTVAKFAPEFNVVDDKDGPAVFFDGRNVTVNPDALENLDEYEAKDLSQRAVVAAKAAPKDPIAASIIQQIDGYSAYNFDSVTRKEIRKSLAKAHAVATENGMAPLAMDLGAKLFEYGGATDADVRKSMARGIEDQMAVLDITNVPSEYSKQLAIKRAALAEKVAPGDDVVAEIISISGKYDNFNFDTGTKRSILESLSKAYDLSDEFGLSEYKPYIKSWIIQNEGVLAPGASRHSTKKRTPSEENAEFEKYLEKVATSDPDPEERKWARETAQSFTDISANYYGYTKERWHGTRSHWTVWDTAIAGGVINTALDEEVGRSYGLAGGGSRADYPIEDTMFGTDDSEYEYSDGVFKKISGDYGPKKLTISQAQELADKWEGDFYPKSFQNKRLYVKADNMLDLYTRKDELTLLEILQTIDFSNAEFYQKTQFQQVLSEASKKPHSLSPNEAAGRYWPTTKNEARFGAWRDLIIPALKKAGYDGIRLRDDSHTTEAVFDAEQIKSAEPFTYDDNGDLIPSAQRFNAAIPDIRYSRARGTEGVAYVPTKHSAPRLAVEKFFAGFRSRGMVTEDAYEIFRNSDAYKREIASFISFIGKDFSNVANKHFGEGEENWLSYRIFSRDLTGEVTVSKTGFKTAKEAESFATLNRIKDYTVATGEDLMNRALGSNGPTLSENVREKIEQLTRKGLDDIAKSIAAYKEEYLDYWNLVMLETQADMVDAKQIATLRERKQQWMKALQLRAAEQRQIVDDARKEAVRVALKEGTNRIIAQQQFAKSYLPDDLVHQIERSRAKIDELSGRLTKIEWLMDGSQLQMIIDAKTGVYVTRSYEAFETNDRVGYVNWLDEAYRALYDPKQDYDPLAKERIMPLVRHLKNNIIERRIEDLKLENEQRQVDEIMADLMTDPRQVTQVDMVPGQSTEGTEYEELVRAVAKRELLRRRSEEKKDFIRRAMRSLALNGFASNIGNARKRLPVLRKEANRLYDQRYPEQVAVAGIMGAPNALRYTLMTDDEAHDIANTERAISENPGSVNGSKIWTASISGEKHSSFYAAVNDDFRQNLDFITGAPSSKTGFSGATANDWKRLGDKILEHKNDVPAFLRTFLGERDNPLLRVSDTLLKQSHLIAVGELYQNLAKTGMAQGWIVDRGTLSLDGKKYAGWKTILDSEKTNQGYENNPFSGKYIDPVMADAINVMLAANQPSNFAFKTIAKIVGFSLWGVTAGSVKAIIRNLASAPSFLLNSGFLATILDPRRWRSTAQNVALASIVMQESMSSVAKVSGGKKIEGNAFKLADKVWTGLLTIAASQRTATGLMKGVGTIGELATRMKVKPTSEAAQQFYSLAVRLGVANDNVQKEAMERLLSLEETISRQPKDKNLGRFAKALKLDGVVGFGSYLLSTIKSAGQQRSQLYGAPDDFTKILAWLNEMDSQARIHAKDTAQYKEWKGADGLFTNMPENLVKLAADHTTDTIQSHSKVWAHITQFKKAGLGVLLAPFVAARAEFYRNAINAYRIGFQEIRSKNTKERGYGAARIASAFLAHTVYAKAAGIALSMIFKAMADDDDVAEDSPEKREAIRKLGPEYAKNKNATYVVYKNGTFDWLDISFSDPFSFVSSSLNAARRGIDEKAVDDHVAWSVAKELMAENFGTFISPQIAVGASATMISGYDPVRGIKIWDSQADTTAEKVQKAIAYYAKQAGTPGDIKSAMNIIKAARGIEENGRQYKLGTEIGGVFLGASVRTIKVTDMVEQKLAQAKDNLNTRVGALYEAQLRDSNDVDMDDVVAATETYHRVGQDAIRRMQKVWKAGETLLSDTPGGQKMLNAVMESDKVKMNAVTERAIKTGKNVPSALSPQTEQKVGDLGKKHGDDRLPVTKDTLKRLNQKP